MVRVHCGAGLLYVGGSDLLICSNFHSSCNFNYNLPKLWNIKKILQQIYLKMRKNRFLLIRLGFFYVGCCKIGRKQYFPGMHHRLGFGSSFTFWKSDLLRGLLGVFSLDKSTKMSSS